MINPEFLAKAATDALLQEVNLAPKPGLVDPISTGAHKDMTKDTFYKSIEALRPYLLPYAKARDNHNGTPLDLFNELRALGKQAEDAMMAATNHINTHKGANFSFALVLGATAHTKGNIPEALHYCHLMTRHLIEVDFANLDQKEHLSYGEKLYVEHGITGIRGEAATGYPSLAKALDYYQSIEHLSKRHRDLLLLLYLMTFVEDGNIIHRGGIEAYKNVQQEAKLLFDEAQTLSEEELVSKLEDYDQVLIERNLSPGGSADLLSLTFFLEQIQKNG